MKFGSSLLKRVGIKGLCRIATRMRLLATLQITVRNGDCCTLVIYWFLNGTSAQEGH
jgi:hypothetical protein